jgi:hypothetical protein
MCRVEESQMMQRRMISCVGFVLLVPAVALAQSSGKKSAAATRTLDVTAQKLEAEFLKGVADLASSYEEAGDKEKAKAMLQAILKLRPDAETVKEKLKELEESVFTDQQEMLDLDMSKGWVSTGMVVEKGKKLRLESAGSYKLIVNDSLGPDGYQSDSDEVFFDGAPMGALIGMVIPPGTVASHTKGKGPQPFMVGEKKELGPQVTGLLVLRVNAPPGAKCVGRLKVRLSGNFTELAR